MLIMIDKTSICQLYARQPSVLKKKLAECSDVRGGVQGGMTL